MKSDGTFSPMRFLLMLIMALAITLIIYDWQTATPDRSLKTHLIQLVKWIKIHPFEPSKW